MNRYLAAIMFTDLVGYSHLANSDEVKALDLIEINRLHQKPLIKRYGTFVKEMGDGFLGKFKSALDAVACAIEIQNSVPDELKNQIRIGIHLGDISETNSDIFGNGVNIASRLESIAEPGSIYISDSVYNAVKSHKDIQTEYIGEKTLKNIESPVTCHKILGLASGTVIGPSKKRGFNKKIIAMLILAGLAAAIIITVFNQNSGNSKPMVAVLPLVQLDGDTSDLFLEKSLTEELIRTIGRNSSLTVVNPYTTLRYLSSVNPIEQATSELSESDYFIKGHYRKQGHTIEVSMSTLNKSNEEIWSGDYSKHETYLPELISNISNDIFELLEVSAPKRETIKEIKAIDPETYRLYLKGMTIIGTYNINEYSKGITFLEEAVNRSPGDSKAWAGLAEGYVWLGHSPMGPPWAWHKAKSAAISAIQLDSMNAEAWAALAHTKTYFEYDYKGAEIGYKKANDLNPSMAFNHYHYAWHLYLLDSIDKAIEEHKIAQKLDPFLPVHTFWLGGLLAFNGEFDKAKIEIKKALEINPDLFVAYSILGDIYRKQGKPDSAEYAFQRAMEIQPFSKYVAYMPYCFRTGEFDKGLKILEEAKLVLPPGSFKSWVLAKAYAEIDSADQFFKYANYEPAIAFVPWFRKGVRSAVIIGDPRFKELMNKLNLPMPVNLEDNY